MLSTEINNIGRHRARTINITVGPALATLKGSVGELKKGLTRTRIVFDGGCAKGGESLLKRQEFFWRDHRNRLITFAGLARRCVMLLRSRGCNVTVNDTRVFFRAHQADTYVLNAATGDNLRLLEIVTKKTLGQIEVRPNDDVESIGHICQLFRWATIVIVTSSRDRASSLRRDLSHFLGKPVDLLRSASHYPKNRVIVSTPAQLGLFSPGDAHILIIADAAEIDTAKMTEALTSTLHLFLRRYAVIRPGQRFSDGEQVAVQAVSGPVIYTRREKPAGTKVFMCTALAITKPNIWDALTRKRENVWHQPQRNQTIADTANAIANHNWPKLWQLGLFLEESDERWLTIAGKPAIQILVESLEHARVLHELLPDWPIFAQGVAVDDADTTNSARAIITATCANRHEISADILIRADGGNEPIQFRGFPRPADVCHAGQLYLIDYDDDIHPAGRDITRRLDEYREKGWTMITRSSTHSRTVSHAKPGKPRR